MVKHLASLVLLALLVSASTASAQSVCRQSPAIAPNYIDLARSVFAAHPEINMRDEESPSGRARGVDYLAVELNRRGPVAGAVSNPWGRKARQRLDRTDPASGILKNTDGLTLLRVDGCFEIVDVVVGATGEADWTNHGAFAQGENGFWAPPDPLPGATPAPDVPAPPPAPSPVDLGPILARLAALEDRAAQQAAESRDIRAVLAAESKDIRAIIAALPAAGAFPCSALPLYRGSGWFGVVISRPQCR